MYKVFFNDRIVFLTEDSNLSELHDKCRIAQYSGKDFLQREVEEFMSRENEKMLIIEGENPDKQLRELSGLFKTVDAAGGIVRNLRSEILLIFRFGKWDLPKGKTLPGEKPEAAAMREITEECGISEQILVRKLTDTYHTYTEKNKHFLKKTQWFEFLYKGDELPVPQTEEDITEAMWFPPEKLERVFSNTWASLFDVFIAAGLKP